MAKYNYLKLSENAFAPDGEGYFVPTQAFKDAITNNNGVLYIGKPTNSENEDYVEFVGDKTGDKYVATDLGIRDDWMDGGLLKRWDNELGITDISLNGVEGLKRINKISLFADRYNKINSNVQFVIPESVETIESGSLVSIETVYYRGEDESILAQLENSAAAYVNPIIDNTTNYLVYKDVAETQLYGLYPGFKENSALIVSKVFTIPSTVKTIIGWNGKHGRTIDEDPTFDKNYVEKIVLPDDIEYINTSYAFIEKSYDIAVEYKNVVYTFNGTGNNDTYDDLNALLVSDGVIDEGTSFISDDLPYSIVGPNDCVLYERNYDSGNYEFVFSYSAFTYDEGGNYTPSDALLALTSLTVAGTVHYNNVDLDVVYKLDFHSTENSTNIDTITIGDVKAIDTSLYTDTIKVVYDSVEYTKAGTGNNDTYADLNAKLISDGKTSTNFVIYTE